MKIVQPLPKIFFLLLFSISFFNGLGQEKKGKKILIKHADSLYYEKALERNRLLGNVIFEHDGALMYCDSAWAYNTDNKIKAFENVRINQGDTLFLTGDYLEYSGNTKLAVVTGEEVRLKDPKMELITTKLNLNRKTDYAYYQTGGTILNDENTLKSIQGFYNTESKVFNFKDSVVLTNPDYVILSDTLDYNSNTRFAYFNGPTTITSDSSFIYTEDGQYNTVDDIAQFEMGTYLYSNNKYLTGDSLYYEKANDYGEVYNCVFIHDTTDNFIITGNYGEYIGSADSTFVTLDPIYSVDQEGDTLHIHGDTLLSTVRQDSLDSNYRLLQIFHKVKFFKSDLQGMCDSLIYTSLDSVIKMYEKPILWSDSSQITGDTIHLTIRNEVLDSLKVFGNAFIISKIDSTKDNQIKGREMFGKFFENELRKVFVNGNGQTIYYAKDDGDDEESKGEDEWIGMNKSVSSYIMIKLKDSEVESIGFLNKPDVKLYPLDKIPGDQLYLDGFHPAFQFKPRKKMDILIWGEINPSKPKNNKEGLDNSLEKNGKALKDIIESNNNKDDKSKALKVTPSEEKP